MVRRTAIIGAVIAVAGLGLAACGGTEQARDQAPSQGATKDSGASSKPSEPEKPKAYAATEKRMVAGLNVLTKSLPGYDDCSGKKPEGGTIRAGEGLWRPTPAQWFGPVDEKAKGTRAKFMGSLRFCAPVKGEKTSYHVDVFGFESPDQAKTWYDELAAATGTGKGVALDKDNPHHYVVFRVPPPLGNLGESSKPKCAAYGTKEAPTFTSGQAMDIAVGKACIEGKDQGKFTYDPATYSVATSGPWVIALEARHDEGTEKFTYPDGRATVQATKISVVQKDAQKVAVATLVKDLANP